MCNTEKFKKIKFLIRQSGCEIIKIPNKILFIKKFFSFKNKNPGDKIELEVMRGPEKKNVSILLGAKIERSFLISRKPGADNLQKEILESWLQ